MPLASVPLFAVLELLLPGIAIKKDAVCLASWDPNQVHVQVPNSVNASINLNKRQKMSLVLFIATIGERKSLGLFPWTMKQECGSLIQAFARE